MKVSDILNETHPYIHDIYDAYDEAMQQPEVEDMVEEIVKARTEIKPPVDWEWIQSRAGQEHFMDISSADISDELYDAVIQVLHIDEKKRSGVFRESCEIVYTDENGEILSEAAIRQFKKVGTTIKRQYRCTSGPKKGKIVSSPQACGQRKDPKKIRHGKKVARLKKGVRVRKTTISKKKSISKMVTRMNKRLAGK